MGACDSLVDGLRRSAREHAERCAIKDGAREVTYAQLWDQCVQFGAALRAHGLQRHDRVALVLPNCIEFVVACYGALIAGGVAVLLNASGKSRDFRAWLADSEPSLLVADGDNAELSEAVTLLSNPPRKIHAHRKRGGTELGLEPREHEAVDAQATLSENDPAFILYTSGTTGRPKGVVLSHGNLANNTSAIIEYLQLTAADSSVTVLPFYYSYGSSVLHTHLRVGARLVLEQNLVYPHAVVETLAKERATGFAGVPSTYALLLSRVKLGQFELSSLRYATQAGGAMAPALTQRLREELPHVAIVVMYGQTEATARLTYLPPARLAEKLGSVGVAVPGVRIEIRRESGETAATDEVGEVWAQGPNVMLGYWRNDAATTEVKRDGWLKTGDMGRLDADGFLYIVGRRGDMIKAGAHRIHPQDIEEVIAELPGVQETAVVGIEDELFGQIIRAFVVPSPAATLTPMQVQAHCRARLASYKVPKSVEMVTSLPRTASGKIRRVELIERTDRE